MRECVYLSRLRGREFTTVVEISSRLFGLQLTGDHRLQRFDRLEIFRCDRVLRNREIESSLDRQHQVDHVHRRQPDIDQRGMG